LLQVTFGMNNKQIKQLNLEQEHIHLPRVKCDLCEYLKKEVNPVHYHLYTLIPPKQTGWDDKLEDQ